MLSQRVGCAGIFVSKKLKRKRLTVPLLRREKSMTVERSNVEIFVFHGRTGAEDGFGVDISQFRTHSYLLTLNFLPIPTLDLYCDLVQF